MLEVPCPGAERHEIDRGGRDGVPLCRDPVEAQVVVVHLAALVSDGALQLALTAGRYPAGPTEVALTRTLAGTKKVATSLAGVNGDAASDEDLRQIVPDTDIFARTSPEPDPSELYTDVYTEVRA